MSVGGKVLEAIVLPGKVWVNTWDGHDECAIYVERTDESRTISEGDGLWWQGGNAYWTPRDKNGNAYTFVDKILKRRGYSGVNRPATPISEEGL